MFAKVVCVFVHMPVYMNCPKSFVNSGFNIRLGAIQI